MWNEVPIDTKVYLFNALKRVESDINYLKKEIETLKDSIDGNENRIAAYEKHKKELHEAIEVLETNGL